MAVGTTPLTCYEDEDVIWTFTVTDSNVSSISGWTITFRVKEKPARIYPTLLGPVTASVTGALTCQVSTQITLPVGTYSYSLRRTDAGTEWQLAQGTLTVIDSIHVD